MPPFLGLQQKNFNPNTYKPPTELHDGGDPTRSKFSPFSVATSTIHWRHDPQDSSKLQSNSRIIRWSDGSLTLQIASSPKDQYRISTTVLRQTFGQRNKSQAAADYDPSRDANAYLSAPHTSSNLLQVIAPISAAMRILPTGSQTDESVLRLQNSLAAAQASHDPFAAIKNIKEDPEMAKKAAEQAEKDIARQKRKKEAELERQYTRREKVLGRTGLSRGGGLSVAGLEDEDGMPTTARPKKAKRKINRRGDIYSDDEDEAYPRGRTKEDEYDLHDGFMAASDEEPEIYEDEDAPGEDDDPDVDDLEIEGRETVVQGKTRGEAGREREVTPKRAVEDEAVSGAAGSPHAGRKKRRVIDDDDDDE
jgi:RNA polymerase-associated protein LEO1